MITFPFKKRQPKRLGEVLKPLIPVRLVGPESSETVLMLLDSGADLSLIPYSVGEAIGLEPDMSRRSEIQGVGEGSVPYILSRVQISIGATEVPVRIGWTLIEEVPLLLGRLDVFRHFAIEFRTFENKILLKAQQEE
jgi:hypothetical protein